MIFLIIPIIFKIKHLEVANGDVKKMFFKCLLNSQEKPEWCVFLWTLRSFEEHPFYKTPPDDFFWTLTIFEKKKKWLKMSTYFRLEEFSNTSKILAQRKVSIASNWAFCHPNILTSYVSAINERLLTDTSYSDL